LTCFIHPKKFTTANTLVAYDPRVSPNLPAKDGTIAGTYIDGTIAYVGIAHTTPANNYCGNQRMLPARVTTDATAPGAYGECGPVQYDGVAAQYLVNDPNFKWVPATQATVPTIQNGVLFDTGTGYMIMYGRINLTSSKGVVYTVVSKVHLDHYATKMYFNNELGQAATATTGFEVLTCVPTVKTILSNCCE
jgi:hypothetical protein